MKKGTRLVYFTIVFSILFSFCIAGCSMESPSSGKPFVAWQPKPLKYKGELVEKWSLDIPPQLSDIHGIIRKDGWKITTNDWSCYNVSERGLSRDSDNPGFGIDDANSSARIEKILTGSMAFYKSAFSLLPDYTFDCGEYRTNKNCILALNDFPGSLSKIDCATGKELWKIDYDSVALQPNPCFFVVKNKVALNTCRWGRDKDGNPDTPGTVTLVDLDSGIGEVLDIPGSVMCTVYNDELYVIIDEKKVSKYDIENKKLTGKMFDVTKIYQKGKYRYQPLNYWFSFSSDESSTPDYILNPNTMELMGKYLWVSQPRYCQYDGYCLHSIRKVDRIVGIDNDTFEETWQIPLKNLSQSTSAILGDERGILIQDRDRLVCFGPP